MEKEVSQGRAAVLGLQHLLAMYSGAVAVPLLIGTALNFNAEQMTLFQSIFSCAGWRLFCSSHATVISGSGFRSFWDARFKRSNRLR